MENDLVQGYQKSLSQKLIFTIPCNVIENKILCLMIDELLNKSVDDSNQPE